MTQAFLFFSFQLALPKTSVLLLCQRNSDFLTFFILFFCPFALSFAFETFCALPFGISPVVFLFSVVSFAVFWGQYSLFFNVCLFQQRFSYLFYIVFCTLPLSFAFETFCALPFSILQTAFCPLLPLFVFCVWDSPFALLLTAICCKNLLLDKKFSKNKKSLEIVIKTFDNT